MPSMPSPTSMGLTGAQSMPALTAGSPMNESLLRAGASNQIGPDGMIGATGTGLMGSSPSQPNVSVPHYGTSSSSQFVAQPRPSLPQMVYGALKSTFGASRQRDYEPEDPGPYNR